MESMSINPDAAAIGSQLIDVANRGLTAGAQALPALTELIPAGAEEVSLQAAMAFAAEAEAMLALNAAAQQELARAGSAVTEIAEMYSHVDGDAAGTLAAGGSRFLGRTFAGGAGANTAAGLIPAETLRRAVESAARTPLIANAVGGVAASNPVTLPAAAGAASTVLGAATAPLSSIGQFTSAGAAAGPGLASSNSKDPDDSGGENPGDQQPGERLL
jgi:hypothetical protein